jgi:putative Holliday junction resolvase
MGRILAIDYGLKRSGIAVSDPLKIIAGGLTTVQTDKLLSFILDYISKEKTEKIIIGKPTQMNGNPSQIQANIDTFVNKLKQNIPDMIIDYADERFTSVLAHKTILEAGLSKNKRQNKALADEISAVIILQTYMESKKNI